MCVCMINSGFPLLIHHRAHHKRHVSLFVDKFNHLAFIIYKNSCCYGCWLQMLELWHQCELAVTFLHISCKPHHRHWTWPYLRKANEPSTPMIYHLYGIIVNFSRMRYCNFQDVSHTPSWIFKFRKFQWLTRCEALRCISMPNFSKIGLVKWLLRYHDFSVWHLVAILDFYILEILTANTVRRAKMHHHVKCCLTGSNGCSEITILDF